MKMTTLSFRNNMLWFVLLLATLLHVVPTCQLGEERYSREIHLAHLCVNIDSEPEEGVPVIMLHGLSDKKETWDGIYENISLVTHRKVCIYDARNHGDSGWSDAFSVDVLAEDLGKFMRDMNIEKAALVGHSMGGLIITKFALKNPDKVEGLFIEDISPIGIPKDIAADISSYLQMLVSSLTAIPDDADEDTAKKAVIDYLNKVLDVSTVEYLFKKFPLSCRDGVWQWKANFNVFIKSLEDVDSFLGKMQGQYDGKVTFIYGKASPFKMTDDKEAILKLFPKAEFIGIEGAGHVIHPIYPELFLNTLIKFLK